MTQAPAAPSPLYPPPFAYADRLGKAKYIAHKYAPILGESVLDVGCDQKQLAGHLKPAVRYVGIDIAPPADVVLDLDRLTGGHILPFGDGAYATVIAADVLEHLEQIHAVFDELCRVAASRVIVSLPNPARNFVDALAAGTCGRLKFYGLPVDRPVDRHRWFFGAEESAHFLRERGLRQGFEVEQLDSEELTCPVWTGKDGKNRLSSPNLTGGTTWCVLRRA